MINGTTFCPALFCSHIQAADEIQMVEQNAAKYLAFNKNVRTNNGKLRIIFLSNLSFLGYHAFIFSRKTRKAEI